MNSRNDAHADGAENPNQATTPNQNDVFASSNLFGTPNDLVGGEFADAAGGFGFNAFQAMNPPNFESVDAGIQLDRGTISCLEVHHNLQFFLDGELSHAESEAMGQHLAMCPPCQSAQAFQMQLRTTIASKAVDPAPDMLKNKIASALGFDS